MNVIARLATSLGRRDEIPNVQLAETISREGDEDAVSQLIVLLQRDDKNIQSDSIKVLYEIGERKPELIASYCKDFGQLLNHKNNRLVWGAMTALDAIASVDPRGVYLLLSDIMATAQRGSVITRDHAVGMLVKLSNHKSYASKCIPLLLRQIKTSPSNQFPLYLEKSLVVINRKNAADFKRVASLRMGKLEKESQRKRVERLLKKFLQ